MSMCRRCVFEFPLAALGHPHCHLAVLRTVTVLLGESLCPGRAWGFLPSHQLAEVFFGFFFVCFLFFD